MTSFQIFAGKLCRALAERYGESYRVELKEIKKNNGVTCHSITIMQEGSNISPAIYLDRLYREYEDGTALADILQKIIRIYESYRIEGSIDLKFLLDFERAKGRIVYRLVNYENNREMLSQVPYVQYLDMAVVFYYSMEHERLGNIAIMVRDDICRMWGIGRQELLTLAEKNTPRLLACRLKSMEHVIAGLGGIFFPDAEGLCMYVLTNERGMYGAACLLYPDVLRDFARAAGTNFYILPSSVHEVIFVPEREGVCGEEFKGIVREINREQLEREDVLSDCVYYFDRERERLEKI